MTPVPPPKPEWLSQEEYDDWLRQSAQYINAQEQQLLNNIPIKPSSSFFNPNPVSNFPIKEQSLPSNIPIIIEDDSESKKSNNSDLGLYLGLGIVAFILAATVDISSLIPGIKVSDGNPVHTTLLEKVWDTANRSVDTAGEVTEAIVDGVNPVASSNDELNVGDMINGQYKVTAAFSTQSGDGKYGGLAISAPNLDLYAPFAGTVHKFKDGTWELNNEPGFIFRSTENPNYELIFVQMEYKENITFADGAELNKGDRFPLATSENGFEMVLLNKGDRANPSKNLVWKLFGMDYPDKE